MNKPTQQRNRRSNRLFVEALEGRRLLASIAGMENAETESEHGDLVSTSHSRSNDSNEIHYSGKLLPADATSTAKGRVEFESESEKGIQKSEFKASVSGLEANANYTVNVDGADVGTIHTNSAGVGKLVRKSGAPAVVEGSVVNINDASGATVLSTTLSSGAAPIGTTSKSLASSSVGDTSSQSTHTELKAKLADPAGVSKLRGEAEYESETEHGLVVSKFSVSVKGGTPGETIDVKVDDVLVGSITLDSLGRGRLVFSSHPIAGKSLPFPADFPAVSANSVVTVGGVSTGKLSTSK